MTLENIFGYFNELPACSHAVLFYDDTSDKQSIISEIVRDGIEKNEVIACFCQDVSETGKYLNVHGINVEEASKQAIMNIKQINLNDYAYEMYKEFLESSIKEERQFRIILDSPLDISSNSQLIKIEKAYDARFEKEKFSGKLLCVYSSKECIEINNGRLFFDLIKTHSHALFPGIALKIK